jgi:hypothetical protein
MRVLITCGAKARVGPFSKEGVMKRPGTAVTLITEIYADEI